MPFQKEDFTQDIARELNAVIMEQMGRHPLFNFGNLNPRSQNKFNKLLNEFINQMPDDWRPYLAECYNDVMCDRVFNEGFKAELCTVKEIQHAPETEAVAV